MPTLALWNMQTFNTDFAFDNYLFPSGKIQTSYLATHKLCRRISIMNTARLVKTTVKIKLYRQLDSITTPSSRFQASCATQTQLSTNTQEDGYIPSQYQLAGRTSEGNNGYEKVLVDPKISLENSANWSISYDHVKTFTKTLQPGELWEWTEELNCGAGLNFDKLAELNLTNVNATIGYVPIIEVMGPKVLGCWNSNTEENFIGTAPSYIQTEVKKWHETVNSSHNNRDSKSASEGSGGFITDRYQLRIFSKAVDDKAKIFNVNVADIVDSPDGASNQLFIPIMSDSSVQYAKRVRDDGTGG